MIRPVHSPSDPANQAELPSLRPDGASHLAGCGCPRCRGWVQPRPGAAGATGSTDPGDAGRVRAQAEAALARRRERRRAKALALQLELADGERRTDEYLRQQAQIAGRLKEDHRLEVLLAARNAGKPVAEAIADVERRFGGAARRSSAR
jgi:hypothetical protein